MPSKLAEAYMEIRGDTSRLPGDLSRAKSVLTNSLSSMANIAGGVLAATGIMRVADMAIEGAKSMVTFNASLEQYRISLGVMLKDQERANKLIADVQKMAAQTPFSTASLIKGVQLLKAYGFETEKLLPMMKTIGDAAAASPEGMESGVHRISLALGQIQAKGHLMTQEINQLTEAGVPAWEILSKRLNKSVSSVMQMVEQRKISSAQAIEALTKGMDDRFGGMMEKQSHTFSGMWSTIVDNANIALGKIGEPIFGAIKDVFTELVSGSGSGGFSDFTDGIRDKVQVAVDFIRTAFSELKSFFGPIFSTIASQGSVIGEIISNIARQAKESFLGMGEIISHVWRSVFGEGFGTMLKDGFVQLMDYMSIFTTDFTKTWEFVANYLTDIWYSLVDTWQSVWGTMKDVATGVIEGLMAGWNALVNNLMVALEDAERLWNKLQGKGGWSTKDKQLWKKAEDAYTEERQLREQASAMFQSSVAKRKEAMTAKLPSDAFGNTLQDSAQAILQRKKLIEADREQKQAAELRKQADEAGARAKRLAQEAEDHRTGKTGGTVNVYDAYANGAARGTAMSQERNKAERERARAERAARQQALEDERNQIFAAMKNRRDANRNSLAGDDKADPRFFEDVQKRQDELHAPLVMHGSKSGKAPDTGASGKINTGTVEDLYSAIQKKVGKKAGDDTLLNAAKATLEEKQARLDAYKATKDMAGKNFVPKAA